MNLWLAISLVLGVVTIYLLSIEIFSVAFKLTGLATSKIKFQVGSLFTGAGYTTTESELVVSDKKRRKIALTCMYTGHIFSVAFMGLVINVLFSIAMLITSTSFEMPTFTEWYFIILYITLFFFILTLIIKIPPVNKRFQNFLETLAINHYKKKEKGNLMTVLDLYGKYAIAEIILNYVPEFAKDVPLYQMGLNKNYSINVLSIKRGNRIIDVSKDTMFCPGDILVLYGLSNDIKQAFISSINQTENIVELDKNNEVNLINNYGPNALVDIYVENVPEELAGIKMQDTHLKDRYNITIGIIKRKEEYIYVDKDTIIQKGDVLTLFGPYKNIKILFANENN